LIGSFEISDKIATYYEAINLRQREHTLNFDYFKRIRSIIRPEIQKFIFDNCEELNQVIRTTLILNESCNIDIDENLVNSIMEQIENHPTLESEFIFETSYLQFNINLFREQVISSEKLLTLLSTVNQ